MPQLGLHTSGAPHSIIAYDPHVATSVLAVRYGAVDGCGCLLTLLSVDIGTLYCLVYI